MDQDIRNTLRDEYFRILPDIRKILEQMEAKINYALISIRKKLKSHERIEIQSRIKDCESAIDALRRRQQGGIFPKSFQHSLLELKDLAGVRVLVFPRRHIEMVDQKISKYLVDWSFDPIKYDDPSKEIMVKKYFGYVDRRKKTIYGEYQIVPMLIGLFWQVEHAVLYKPEPMLKGIGNDFSMVKKREAIYSAFYEFESRFEDIVTTNIDKGYYR